MKSGLIDVADALLLAVLAGDAEAALQVACDVRIPVGNKVNVEIVGELLIGGPHFLSIGS